MLENDIAISNRNKCFIAHQYITVFFICQIILTLKKQNYN